VAEVSDVVATRIGSAVYSLTATTLATAVGMDVAQTGAQAFGATESSWREARMLDIEIGIALTIIGAAVI
jgi:hypothetical protein